MEISSKERKIIEKAAQPMNASVLIGGSGVTPEQIKHISLMFETHEVIKVKFNEFKDEKRELAETIAKGTDSTLVRIIGNVAIFYKMSLNKNVDHIL